VDRAERRLAAARSAAHQHTIRSRRRAVAVIADTAPDSAPPAIPTLEDAYWRDRGENGGAAQSMSIVNTPGVYHLAARFSSASGATASCVLACADGVLLRSHGQYRHPRRRYRDHELGLDGA